MTRFPLFLPLALLVPLVCTGQDLRPEPQPLRSGCSPDDERLGRIGFDDAVEVHQALAGGEQTCYRVTVTRGGQILTGYVLGDALPAVTAFLHQQQQFRDASFEAQEQAERARQAALARAQAQAAAHAQTANAPPGAKLNPDMPASFENFNGRDVSGKPVSLTGLGGRVTLVTFWSPRNASSKGQLLTVLPLYNQYKRAGLRAVGISMDPNPAHITEALDDITLGWPQMADRSGMAKRYGAGAKGTTLVLDSSHHIVAAGLTPAELEKKVRELLAAR